MFVAGVAEFSVVFCVVFSFSSTGAGASDASPVLSFRGSLDSAVLDSAVLASGFWAVGTGVRSGFVFTGFAAKLSSSSLDFEVPQHKNERNRGDPFFFGPSANVLGDPVSGVVPCGFSVMTCGCCSERLLLAVLPATRLPVRLRFELLEPNLKLFDDPCTVSPLNPVVADGKSSFVCWEEAGSSRLDCFMRFPSASSCSPRSDAESERRAVCRFSFEDLPRDEVRLGISRRDDPEAEEFLRCAELSGEAAAVSIIYI
jgi:hypothetical protein